MLKIALLAVLLAAGARGPREGRSTPAVHSASRNTAVVLHVAAPAVEAPAPASEPAKASAPPCPASPICFTQETFSINDPRPPRSTP